MMRMNRSKFARQLKAVFAGANSAAAPRGLSNVDYWRKIGTSHLPSQWGC